MELTGSYLFFRRSQDEFIGVLELLADGRIKGGSANEVFWRVDGTALTFENRTGHATSAFDVATGSGNYEGDFLLPFEGRLGLRHLLRKVLAPAQLRGGPFETIASDGVQARRLSDANVDFSYVLAPPAKVKVKPRLVDFSAFSQLPRGAVKFFDRNYKSPSIFFHVVHDALLLNGSIVRTRQGFIRETAYQAQIRGKGLKYAAREEDGHIYPPVSDETISLSGTWFLFNTLIGNFAHFHVQSLVNSEVLSDAEHLLDCPDMNVLSVSLPGHAADEHYERFRVDAVRRFGLDLALMQNPLQYDGKALKLERLVIPSTHEIPAKECFNPYLIGLLRKRLVLEAQRGGRRLLLSRADVGNSRGITNFNALSAMAADYGFETVVIGDLSYDEQMATMAEAEVVISPHGGNLTSMLAHSGGLKILELTHSHQLSTWFRNLAALCGHDYSMVCSSPVEPHWYSSFEVDLDKVRDYIKDL